MTSDAVLLPASFLISLLVGLACIRWIGPLGFMDVPRGRRQHASPVPRVGGIAFWLSFVLCNQFFPHPIELTKPAWAAIVVTIVIGALDDRFELRARWKAFVGLLVALLLAWTSLHFPQAQLHHLHLLIFDIPESQVIRLVLLTALFWGIPQAFNLIDGANGLAIGYGILVSTCLFVQGIVGALIPVLLLGLFCLNWPRAKLFLGDCGALSLGLLFADLAQKSYSSTDPNTILWIFAYPIIDVSVVTAIRILNGKNPLKGDRNHLHHQLARFFGPNPYIRVPILWLLSGCCASMSFVPVTWRIIPWAGLICLGGISLTFLLLNIRKPSRTILN